MLKLVVFVSFQNKTTTKLSNDKDSEREAEGSRAGPREEKSAEQAYSWSLGRAEAQAVRDSVLSVGSSWYFLRSISISRQNPYDL